MIFAAATCSSSSALPIAPTSARRPCAISPWLSTTSTNEADAIQPLFITLDPERDDVEAMADYVTAFDPRVLGLTGTREEIDRGTAAYRIYSARVPLGDDDYTVDHSAYTYLLDREGE